MDGLTTYIHMPSHLAPSQHCEAIMASMSWALKSRDRLLAILVATSTLTLLLVPWSTTQVFAKHDPHPPLLGYLPLHDWLSFFRSALSCSIALSWHLHHLLVTSIKMRYEDWDVLLFPRDCGIPFREFGVTCQVVQDTGKKMLPYA